VDESWTINELVEEVGRRIAALPRPQNGQVRAVPDDRTVRYYQAIGLLDRPSAMRGRTALYGKKHVAQVVAIKRLQTMGRSLAEIQALWPTLDDATLARMSGIELPGATQVKPSRKDFWKAEPAQIVASPPPRPTRAAEAAELRVELAPNVLLSIALSDDIAISMADVAAIRAAAAPLIAELARRQLAVHAEEGDDV
jgi:DNA-binding transcriptional MerR regulator